MRGRLGMGDTPCTGACFWGPIQAPRGHRAWEVPVTSAAPVPADVSEDRPTVPYYAEMPIKDKTTEEWLKGNAAYLASTKPAGGA